MNLYRQIYRLENDFFAECGLHKVIVHLHRKN